MMWLFNSFTEREGLLLIFKYPLLEGVARYIHPVIVGFMRNMEV